MDFGGLADVLDKAVGAGAFPGAVVLVSQHGRPVYHAAFGCRSREPEKTPMRPDTVFDLSSLTKPLATTTAFMLLVREGKVRIDDRVTRFFPNFGVHGKTQVAFRHLLTHSSGLPAWRPFFKEVLRVEKEGRPNFIASHGARELVYEMINREKLEYETGTRSVYSDVGFMLLGELVETASAASLDRFCRDRIFRPLGLRSTAFVDLAQLRLRKLSPATDVIAPTERCPWRRRILCGEVHDDNAYAMGGVAGHAGLFSIAADVDVLVSRLVACWKDQDDFLPAALMRELWTRDTVTPGSTWALGWDTPSPKDSSAGERIGSPAVGHLGFTGTSVWIDLERDAHVILLTNRVHPHRTNERIRDVRPRVHDAAFAALDA